MNTPIPESVSEGDLTLPDILQVLQRGWKLLLMFALVGGIVGFCIYRWTLPVYKADAMIQIDADKSKLGGNLGELQELLATSSSSETEIELLRSRAILINVCEVLHLNFVATPLSARRRFMRSQGRVEIGYLKLPKLDPAQTKGVPWTLVGGKPGSMTLISPFGEHVASVTPGIMVERAFRGDTVRLVVESMNFSQGEKFSLAIVKPHVIAQRLLNNLTVAEKGKKTGILQLSFMHQYPEKAAQILNEVALSYLQQNIDAKSAEAQKTLVFLKRQLPSVKAKLDSADSLLNNYRLSRGTVDLSAEAKIALDNQVTLQQQILDLQQKRQELTRLYESNHPQFVAVNKQIEQLRSAMGRSSKAVKTLPKTQQEVLKLTRDVTVSTEFYQAMQDKIQQLEVLRAGEVGSVRLIDTAQVPDRPIKPQQSSLLLAGVAGGAFFGFLLLLIRKILDKGVRSVSLIERVSQTSVFAQIPVSNVETKKADKLAPSRILAHESPEEIAVESLRSLRTALEFSILGPGGRVLGIAGLTPGVGKSFVAANLAVLFAKSNKRVLLIDSDLRKGLLHERFKCNRTPGLSEILVGRVDVRDVIHHNVLINGVSFLATGTIPPNPSELLGSPQLKNLISQLRSEFDLIIIDTAPLLLVTDPALVLRHVDHACLVLEQGAHAMPEIIEGLRLMRSNPGTTASIALNKCLDSWGSYGRFTKYGKYNLNSKPEI